MPGYKGGLLAAALDLGKRLLPAFETKTGIPFGTVNLRYGVPKGEVPVASVAGAGSLSIEFGMLSYLLCCTLVHTASILRTGSTGILTASENCTV